MNHRLTAIACACVLAAGAQVQGNDLIRETTEFGITVSPRQLFDAIHETQEYWPPVRRHITSERFEEADLATRKQAAEFIRQVNNRLADQMFGGDEAASLDLLDYIAARIRLMSIYRELRGEIDADELTLAVKERWEQDIRALHPLSKEERAARLAADDGELHAVYHKLGLCDAHCEACADLWRRAAPVAMRLHDTQAGAMMLEYERTLEQGDPQVFALLRQVVLASDWATITKSDERTLRRADFERAWTDLERLRGERTARAGQ